MKRVAMIVLAAAVAVSACGKSKEEKQQEQAAQTAEKAAGAAAKGLEDMAKSLEAMAGGGAKGDAKPVDPISFRDMIALMPELDGWEKAKPTGEKMTSPFAYSTAEATYTKGDSRIEIKMTDSAFNQMLLVPYSMFLTAGYEKETADGYEKSVQVNGQPGWEKWNSEGKNGELNALVNKRFVVQIEGSQIDDTKVLHDVAGKIDMGKLASLK